MTPLRIERKRRGWTLERVANELRQLGAARGYGELGVDANAVSRWELGKHQAQEPYPELFAELYATTVDALFAIMSDMERRDFLGIMAAAPVAAMLPRTGSIDVDAMTAITGSYRRLEATTPARELVAPVRAHLAFVARRADGSEALSAAASEVAGLAAWLAFDQADHATARRSYAAAIRYARDANQPTLAAYMVGSMSLWAAEIGSGNEAVSLVGTLMRDRPASPIGRAWTSAVAATAYASAHRADDAFAALRHVQPTGEPAWPWLMPFDAAKVAGYVGHVATMLGRPRTAIGALRSALDQQPTKARVRTLADLATCYRQLGRPDDAEQAASEAQALAATTGTRRL